MTEGGIVVARGNAAIRGLKLLLNSVISLDKRITQYISQDQNKDSVNPMIINFLDEIKGRCDLMAEEAVNSIENWTDIIPEADLKTQIGIISEYKGKLESSNLELGLLKDKLQDAAGKSEKEIRALTQEIKQKEIEISKLQTQVREKQIILGSPSFSAFTPPGSSAGTISILGGLLNPPFIPSLSKAQEFLSISKELMDEKKKAQEEKANKKE